MGSLTRNLKANPEGGTFEIKLSGLPTETRAFFFMAILQSYDGLVNYMKDNSSFKECEFRDVLGAARDNFEIKETFKETKHD